MMLRYHGDGQNRQFYTTGGGDGAAFLGKLSGQHRKLSMSYSRTRQSAVVIFYSEKLSEVCTKIPGCSPQRLKYCNIP